MKNIENDDNKQLTNIFYSSPDLKFDHQISMMNHPQILKLEK
jgi:hypothetical protein